MAIALLLIVLPNALPAQVLTGTGVGAGTGLAWLPTTGLTPSSHWRVGFGRVELLEGGERGMNVIGMGYGLSTNLEGYVRLTGEQLGALTSLTSYGFGVKGTIPGALPLADAAGVWFETQSTDDLRGSRHFPAAATRGGATFSFEGAGWSASALAGAASVRGAATLLAGAGAAWAPAGWVRFGAEVLRGQGGPGSVQAALDLSLRVAPYVVLQAGPGYVRSGPDRSRTMTLGISLSTAAVDFRPPAGLKAKDQFQLPSLEEIMKEPSEEIDQ